ncbi:MAG: FeoB-associated Cys-rich membrane protein [Bacteroidales bacterium]|nr:FeoB-associated Cys-rich membrane protein [Bacteroidales bacterium]
MIQWIIVGLILALCVLYIVRALIRRCQNRNGNACNSCTSACPLRRK